jgi:hypothetical protein
MTATAHPQERKIPSRCRENFIKEKFKKHQGEILKTSR